ncbi:MAG: sulfite exporter TauE/SafE family protein [Vulcanimicrobiaceae bacterium]
MGYGPALTVELFVIGILASFLGSIVGLGGGFIAIPVLRLVFHLSPALTAGTSLFLVTANVASASLNFLRQRRVDVRLGVTMGLLGIPGSILGAVALRHFTVPGFDVAYAIILIVFAVDLFRRGSPGVPGPAQRMPWGRSRVFHDPMSGRAYAYEESMPLAAGAGVATGFLSSFFGIGGGILVVPLLLRGFLMPPHIVSATSHFVILLSSPFGLIAHGFANDIDWAYALPLAAGGLVGAQFGAETARRISSHVLVRTLAIVMLAAAGSLILQHVL